MVRSNRCLTEAMQVLVASEMSGLRTLGTLARDSIEVGFLFLSRWMTSTDIAQVFYA